MMSIPRNKRPWLSSLWPAGIRQRLFLLISLILLPMLLLLGGVYKERYQTRRTQALQTELEVAQGIATSFAALVDDIRGLNYTLGSAILTFSPYTREKATRLLSFNVLQFRAIRNLSWVNAQGTIMAASDPGFSGRDLSDRSFFQRIAAGQDWALGDLAREGIASEAPSFAIATALRTGGKLQGVVVAEIDTARLPCQERPAAGAAAIFDSQGTVVCLRPGNELSWQERVQWRQGDPLLAAALEADAVRTGLFRSPAAAGDWFGARVPVAGTGWVAGAGRPLDIALAPVRRRAIFDAALALLIASAAFLVAWILARSITRPILRLDNDANRMAAEPVECPADVEAPEEVRRLRRSVSEMAADLREREEEFRVLSEALPQMVWASHPDGKAFYLNSRWLNYTGQSFAEARDLGWLQALHPEDVSRARDRWTAAIETGDPYEVEYRVRGKDGRYRWFLSQGRIIGGSAGRSERWVGTCTDIGAHKALEAELIRAREAAEEASRAKSEFLANMSHEIRTPMTVSLTAIEYLLQIDQDPARRELLEMAEEAGEKLLLLIEDILDFSKIEARQLKISAAPFDLQQCIQDAVKMLALPARKKKLPIRVEVAPDVPTMVDGDADRVGQVLLNLVGNAVKFTKAGEIRVSVARKGKELRFAVADTGIGIPAEKQTLLFQSFMQVDSSLTRRHGGTGLGLAICKGLVELMGGRIWVESREGEGSTFCFTLPLKETPSKPAAGSSV